ncbi:uncharacterized protein LOC127265318 [Andrographis paniculata]|uniref:uncharacterized protein LOC127265318 n=1 Tax=Andrographis paniculata TaxID=175694 RepID=UPI0021E94875|nr:uncharacterized protein LOC127265318 [Andrographis paniculata]XP_051151025.1 uncharacterized protein LOC127265318 [Andrographis paniculata]XP_051151026.1 uncharacterized protein LOC127265318 [Andrographis paniculata]
MEGNLSSRNMLQGNSSFGGFDIQGPLRINHHQQQLGPNHQATRQGLSMINAVNHEHFPLTIGNNQDCDQTVSVVDYGKVDRGKAVSDEDEPSFTDDAGDQGKGKKASSPQWQRVKWTNTMVRLLITAVSYINEDASASEHGIGGVRRKYANLQKKGKWKSVSKVMAERGHFVSPQQCEDKFNDLNKRYKRLNEILGRGTSCEVVENPALLDVMDHISEKAKEEVRKILSSKHLHYEEMCSYHNGNRLHLPPDPDLQRSLRIALRIREDHDDINDPRRHAQEDNDEVDQDNEYDNYGESEENHGDQIHRAAVPLYGMSENPSKRLKQYQSDEGFSFQRGLNAVDCNKTFSFHVENVDSSDPNQTAPAEGRKALQKQWMNHRNHQIEEKKLYIQVQMLELEKERLKWQRFSRKKDRELEMMRMENEKMKLENDRMALEIRQKEIEMGILNG